MSPDLIPFDVFIRLYRSATRDLHFVSTCCQMSAPIEEANKRYIAELGFSELFVRLFANAEFAPQAMGSLRHC